MSNATNLSEAAPMVPHDFDEVDISGPKSLGNTTSDDDKSTASSIEGLHMELPVDFDSQPKAHTKLNAGRSRGGIITEGFWYHNRGAALVLLSMVFAASMDVTVKILTTDEEHGTSLSPVQVLFIRQAITVAGLVAWGLLSGRVRHFPLGASGVRGLLIGRGVAGFIAVFGIYFSLVSLPLAEATVLTFMAPVLACIINAVLMSDETFTFVQQLATFISIGGVVLIAIASEEQHRHLTQHVLFHFDLHAENIDITPHAMPVLKDSIVRPLLKGQAQLLAIFVALLGVIGQAGGMVMTRQLGHRVHTLVIILYSAVASILFCGLALLVNGDVELFKEIATFQWALLIVVAFTGFMFQWLLTEGLIYGTMVVPHGFSSLRAPSPVEGYDSPEDNKDKLPLPVRGNRAVGMMYTQLLFAIIYDVAIWHTLISWQSWLGIALVTIGAVTVALAQP
ncbi:uncharacterized protein JN550_005270 [Neoarthrinium moseri]|uniref:uncharacterized protein n=1 Tax=Neoarthrinium moseri TaxID=1658444 RepID=UPI001FDAF086|nr:uncharacterized protein JN550_005270 [Neoarthrinium moseri]KAI1870342.1 hypothetical protein JN550_005270 [Neoarthrinium moseri]